MQAQAVGHSDVIPSPIPLVRTWLRDEGHLPQVVRKLKTYIVCHQKEYKLITVPFINTGN